MLCPKGNWKRKCNLLIFHIHTSHVSVMCATEIRLYSLVILRGGGGGGYFFYTSIFFAHPPGPKRKEYMLTSIHHVFLRSS